MEEEGSLRDKMANARIGYQVAANLEANEVRALWSRFSAMLTANSIIIGIIGLLWKTAIPPESDKLIPTIGSIVMSFFGLVLCLFWYWMIARKQEFCKYLMISTRELENKYLRDPVRTIVRGRRLTDSQDPICIYDGKRTEVVQMNGWKKHKTANVARYVILAFSILYFIIIALSVILLAVSFA